MQLIKVDVKNYRCLTNVSIPFHKLTVLIGENDSGKSTVLDLLDLILNERQPEDNDFYYVSNSQGDLERRAEEIEAILIFKPYSGEAIPPYLIAQDGCVYLKKRFTKQLEETWYKGRCFVQQVLNQDLVSLKVADLDNIITEVDIVTEVRLNRLNKEKKIQIIQEFMEHAPSYEGWVSVSQATIRDFLPRFERYRSLDYQDPTSLVMKTLRTVFESIIFETDDDGTNRPIASLRELKLNIEAELNNKVSELLGYVQRYNPRVRRVEFTPTIDFSNGLRGGKFSIDDGRGAYWLDKCGDGTKRRLFMALFDWDKV